MTESRTKLKRVKPIIRAREAQLYHEITRLNELRNQKALAISELRKSQGDYADAVNKINNQRQSTDRSMLLTLESTIDKMKTRFYLSLRKVREIETLERQQMTVLIGAERNLKSTEKLRERYEMTVRSENKKVDQKHNDEIANRKYIENK